MSERVFLTEEEAIELLPQGEEIHVFVNPNNGMLIGADWSRESVLKLLKEAESREVGGDACMKMGHGIVVFERGAKFHSEAKFVSHDKEKMKKYE